MLQRMLTAGREAIWVLLTASVLATVAYIRHPGSIRVGAGAAGEASVLDENRITLEQAADLFNEGKAVFADARPADHFEAGHIDGALNLDPDRFDDWAETVFDQIPDDAAIIAYCDGDRCTLSIDLVEKLAWLGYEKVYHIKNGWSLWQERGLPTAAGPTH